MLILLGFVALLLWSWVGFKTWAFVAVDLANKPGGRAAVLYSFLGGLLWPATYSVLAFLLLFGVVAKTPLKRSVKALKDVWDDDKN